MFLILLTGRSISPWAAASASSAASPPCSCFTTAGPRPRRWRRRLGGALVLWTLMGALIVGQRIPSFIITLGGLLIFKGLFWLVIQNATVPVARG
jgi:hypothetical protein